MDFVKRAADVANAAKEAAKTMDINQLESMAVGKLNATFDKVETAGGAAVAAMKEKAQQRISGVGAAAELQTPTKTVNSASETATTPAAAASGRSHLWIPLCIGVGRLVRQI